MKIPKKPDFTKKPYPTDKERLEWDNFVNLIIASVAIIFSLLTLFGK